MPQIFKVQERQPCSFHCIKMEVAGRGNSDWGSYRWKSGDYLLFESSPSPRVTEQDTDVYDSIRVVKGADFEKDYWIVMSADNVSNT